MPSLDTRPPLYRRLERLSESIAQDAVVVSAAVTGRIAGVRQALFLEEVLSSTRLAGFSLDPAAGAALLSRGVAVGGERLAVYEAVADYAEASRLIEGADARPLRPHIYLRTEEILELHRRAMHRTARTAGAWREHNLPAVPSGLVPPPHWLVPREIAAFVDRYAGGPPAEVLPLLWVARAHMRILRIQPFEGGNGRVARLVMNFLLRRLGLPAAAFDGRRMQQYPEVLAAGDAGDPLPLAALVVESVRERMTRLLGALAEEELRPLRDFVPKERLAALVKAAQRGRLRVVRRGARFLTTAAWLADYESAAPPRSKGTTPSSPERPSSAHVGGAA